MPHLKLTPLTRLTLAIERELSIMADPHREAALAEQYLARVQEATARRDSALKGLLVLDALLAIAASGRNVDIPGIGISMADIPALMEVLLGLVSFAVYIGSHSFMNWLCYSQIHHVFSNRIAKQHGVDPDLIDMAENLSEPTLKMLRTKMNIWGADWHVPGRQFATATRLYEYSNAMFFLMLPVLHLMLLAHAITRSLSTSETGITSVFFLSWVFLAHLLAVFVWVVPMAAFTFSPSGSENGRAADKGDEAEN